MGEIYQRLAPLGVKSKIQGREDVQDRGHTPTSAPTVVFCAFLGALDRGSPMKASEIKSETGLAWSNVNYQAERMLLMGVIEKVEEERPPRWGRFANRRVTYVITQLGRELAAELRSEGLPGFESGLSQ